MSCTAASRQEATAQYVLPLDAVTGEPPEHLRALACELCKLLVVDPVQHSCGRMFCASCLRDWSWQQQQTQGATSPTCPTCRGGILNQMVPCCAAVQRLLGGLMMRCDRCGLHALYPRMMHHLAHETTFPCPFRCNERALTLHTCDAHLANACRERAECVFACGFSDSSSAVEQHERAALCNSNSANLFRVHFSLTQAIGAFFPMHSLVRVRHRHTGEFLRVRVQGYTQLGVLVATDCTLQFEASAELLSIEHASAAGQELEWMLMFDMHAHLSLHPESGPLQLIPVAPQRVLFVPPQPQR